MSRKKGKKKVIFVILLSLVILGGTGGYFGYNYYKKYIVAPKPSIENISINDNNELVIKYSVEDYKKYKDIYCLFNTDGTTPSVNDKNWKLAENNECSTLLDDKVYYGFLKNYDGKITIIKDASEYGKITKLEVSKEKIYVAKNGVYNLTATSEKIGNVTDTLKWTSEDESIAKVDETGKVTGVKIGTTKVSAQINGVKKDVEVMVTDLITVRPKSYDYKKKYLGCNMYTKEQNDLLDEILKDRINDAGYKTRAGAVEAARFLVLEFPYKLSYFYENGRQTTNNVDGEGRYYHEGLYLHESRYSNITGSKTGPETWGCPLYCNPGKRYIDNGLDCSGYVSWALLNAGFDVKDVGAGFSNKLDLTDYGDVVKFNDEIINSGKIKVGDLVHSEHSGGHIGMIIGIDEDWFYIAQALWNDAPTSLTKKEENVMAVQITKYGYKEIQNVLPDLVLMDKYYIEDGNLTSMW